MPSCVGAWRRLVARLLWEQDAGCSNHLAPTNRFQGDRPYSTCPLYLLDNRVGQPLGQPYRITREFWITFGQDAARKRTGRGPSHVGHSVKRKRSIRRVLSGRAGSGRSSGRDDQGTGIEMLGQERLALGVGGSERQLFEEVAQIAVWLQTVGLSRFDEGVDGGRGVGSARMA